MHALLLTGLLLLLALSYYHFLTRPRPPRPTPGEPAWLIDARRRFWLLLYTRLCRFRRIWRYCRRHLGFGIEILQNAQFLAQQLL